MKHSNLPKIFVLLSLMVILLTSLACSLTTPSNEADNELALQQTLVALQATNAALERQDSDSQAATSTPTETTPIEQPPTPTTETVEQPDIVFQGISFSFDPNIASQVLPSSITGQNMGEEYMPGDTYPTYVEFTFDNYAVPNHFHQPRISIYPVAEYRQISSYASQIIDDLQMVLNSQPSGGASVGLPFLPMWPAAQMFASNVSIFNFRNGKGIRFLTMYGQAAYPIDNQNLFYTYQGITNDGQYYISAILPVTHPDLLYDGSIEVDDWEAFSNDFQNYLEGAVSWLNSQNPDQFTPSITLLDEMMASFAIHP
jgi:type II secretory pathway pseudopilin PulG